MLKKLVCMVIVATMMLSVFSAVSAGATGTGVTQDDEYYVREFIYGDIDLDGEVKVIDATLLQQYFASIVGLSDVQLSNAQVLGGYISIADATEIQRYVAGLECTGCTGESYSMTVTDDDFVVDEDDIITPPVEDDEDPDKEPVDYSIEEIEKAVTERFIELVNEERARVGVPTLKTNADLTKAASIRSDELVTSFSHTRPDGTNCYTAIENTGNFLMLGENVAYNAGIVSFSQYDKIEDNIEKAAKLFFGQFKSSKGHYANMIRESFNCHGVSTTIIDCGGYYECYMAHMFGQLWK